MKKCEKAAAAAAAAAETQAEVPVAKRKSAKRGVAVASRRAKASRFVTRMAPGFAVRRGQGLMLASGSSRTILLPESALARRFRGFIDPQPMAQNAFEMLRKPHLVALNLEPAAAMPSAEPVAPMPTVVAEPPVAPAASPAVAVVTTAKQDRAAAKPAPAKPPAQMELASAESRPVTLAEPVAPAKPIAVAAADMAPAAATAQSFLTESPHPAPADHQPSRFPVHQLVLALCGALGVASALRFIVGA